MTTPLWQPSPERIAQSNLTAFMARVESAEGVPVPDYPALHRWSVADSQTFWRALWDFCDVRAEEFRNLGQVPRRRRQDWPRSGSPPRSLPDQDRG